MPKGIKFASVPKRWLPVYLICSKALYKIQTILREKEIMLGIVGLDRSLLVSSA